MLDQQSSHKFKDSNLPSTSGTAPLIARDSTDITTGSSHRVAQLIDIRAEDVFESRRSLHQMFSRNINSEFVL